MSRCELQYYAIAAPFGAEDCLSYYAVLQAGPRRKEKETAIRLSSSSSTRLPAVKIPAVVRATGALRKSSEERVQAFARTGRARSCQINAFVSMAKAASDIGRPNFLQWFMNAQLEEALEDRC